MDIDNAENVHIFIDDSGSMTGMRSIAVKHAVLKLAHRFQRNGSGCLIDVFRYSGPGQMKWCGHVERTDEVDRLLDFFGGATDFNQVVNTMLDILNDVSRVEFVVITDGYGPIEEDLVRELKRYLGSCRLHLIYIHGAQDYTPITSTLKDHHPLYPFCHHTEIVSDSELAKITDLIPEMLGRPWPNESTESPTYYDPQRLTDNELAVLRDIRDQARHDGLLWTVDAILARNPPV